MRDRITIKQDLLMRVIPEKCGNRDATQVQREQRIFALTGEPPLQRLALRGGCGWGFAIQIVSFR